MTTEELHRLRSIAEEARDARHLHYGERERLYRRFMEAATPAVVLALIDEIDRLTKELDEARIATPTFWDRRDLDMARKLIGDPTIVHKRWPGGRIETAQVVGDEAERAERNHRTMIADSAPYLLRQVVAWLDRIAELRAGGEGAE